MKKISAVIAMLIACMTVFSACAQNDKFVYRISGDIDFGGETIYFASGWPSNIVPEIEDDGQGTAGDPFGDAFAKHFKDFIKTYNVKAITPIANASNDNILMQLLAGTNKCTFIDNGQAFIYNLYKLNLLWAFNDLTNVDLTNTDVYGTPEYLASVTFQDGKTYGMKVMGGWNTESVGNGLLFYNGNIIRQMGAEDPWQLYRDGKWTFSNFSSYLDTVSDMTSTTTPIYGLEVYQNMSVLFYSSIFANGGSIYNNDSGSWQFSMLTDPRTVAALNWASSIAAKDNVTIERQNGGAYFEAGQAAMFLGSEAIYSSAIQTIDDLYYIPFPKGISTGADEVNYSTFMGSVRMMAVPSDRDPDSAGYFMSLYFSDFKDYTLAKRQERSRRNHFFSDDSFNYYVDSSKFVNSIGAGYPLNISSTSIINALINIGNGTSYTSALTSISSQVQRELDDVLNKNK